MGRDGSASFTGFLRFLAGNPDGDSAARAMAMGALSPVGVIAAQIYALGSDERLDLVGSYGFPADYSATFRSIPLSMSLPACDAFTSTKAVSVRADSLNQNYPLIGLRPGDAAIPAEATRIVSVPCLWSQVPIGALSLLQEARPEPEPQEWLYLDGVAAATAMWMNSQRPYLVEHWRRAAPLPHREFALTERQQRILELIGRDRTNGEIAKGLGYSIPTIKKDLQEIMKLLGTQDRRTTAGRAREIGLLPDRRGGAERA